MLHYIHSVHPKAEAAVSGGRVRLTLGTQVTVETLVTFAFVFPSAFPSVSAGLETFTWTTQTQDRLTCRVLLIYTVQLTTGLSLLIG